MSLLKDKRASVIAAKVLGLFTLLASIVTGIFSFMPGYKSDNTVKPSTTGLPIISVSQIHASDSMQAISTGSGDIYINQVEKLEKYRQIGKKEGYKEGYIEGFNNTVTSETGYNIPESVINQMFPMINGKTYNQRKEDANKLCVIGSLADRDICYQDVLEGRYNAEVSRPTEEMLAKEKLIEDLAKDDMALVTVRFNISRQTAGGISVEESVLRKAEKWLLVCSDKRGCELLDYDSTLPALLSRVKEDEVVVEGKPVNRGELSDTYRLRMTSLYFNRKIRHLSKAEITELTSKDYWEKKKEQSH
ncbi:hypothetical protein ACUWUW_004311 [Vibrio vulnificus]